MELQEVVDDEGRLVSRDTLVWLLAGLAAHGTRDTVIASFHNHGEVAETLVTEAVQTWQCSGLSVALQTDGTGQLLLELLESIASRECFLCHDKSHKPSSKI